MKLGEIETCITKRLSFELQSSDTLPIVHIEVKNDDGVLSSMVHCGMDVAKFSAINTTDENQFFSVLTENGFMYHTHSTDSIREIHEAYNSVLDSFRG